MDGAPTSTRTVLLTALLVGLVTCGTCAGGAYWGLHRVGEALAGSSEWSEDAVARTQVAPLFGVTLPPEVLAYRSRAMGFQDWSYEVLVQLRPADEARWLAANHLAPSAEPAGADLADLEAEIRRVAAPKGTARATLLEGLPRETDDAGVPTVHRRATLLEYDDQVWVYLDSFEA